MLIINIRIQKYSVYEKMNNDFTWDRTRAFQMALYQLDHGSNLEVVIWKCCLRQHAVRNNVTRCRYSLKGSFKNNVCAHYCSTAQVALAMAILSTEYKQHVHQMIKFTSKVLVDHRVVYVICIQYIFISFKSCTVVEYVKTYFVLSSARKQKGIKISLKKQHKHLI